MKMWANQKKETLGIPYLSYKNMKSLSKQLELSKSPVYRLVWGNFLRSENLRVVQRLLMSLLSVIDRGSDIIIHRILVGSYIEKLGLLKRGDIIR